MAPISPSSCSLKVTSCTALNAARHRSTLSALIISMSIRTSKAPNFFLHYGDMTDATNLIRLIQETQPTEIYNLAAQSHVQVSFETPEYTANADALGTLRLLEAIRILRHGTAGTLLSGLNLGALRQYAERRRTKRRRFAPRSPYGAAKLYAYWITVNYREAYGMHASNGILVQPREPDPRRNVRYPQNLDGGGGDRGRPAGAALHRQSRREARLGSCARLCRGHVADCSAAESRTTMCWRPAKPIPCGNSSSTLSR